LEGLLHFELTEVNKAFLPKVNEGGVAIAGATKGEEVAVAIAGDCIP